MPLAAVLAPGPLGSMDYLVTNEKAAVIPYENDTGSGLTGLGRVSRGCNVTGNGAGQGQLRVTVAVLEDE